MVNRERITALATATRRGTPDERAAAQAQLTDTGILIASAFDLAWASIDALAAVTDPSPADWCRIWATATAGGIGVDT